MIAHSPLLFFLHTHTDRLTEHTYCALEWIIFPHFFSHHVALYDGHTHTQYRGIQCTATKRQLICQQLADLINMILPLKRLSALLYN